MPRVKNSQSSDSGFGEAVGTGFGRSMFGGAVGNIVGGALSGAGAAIGGIAEGAGRAVQGIGSAIGGALQGALTPAPKTIINNVGIAGVAGKKKVSGRGTLPSLKKAATPTVDVNMPTEKLLNVAVKYLVSIDKTLQDQIKFERLAYQQQAQAEREAVVESEAKGPGIFSRLGSKFGAIREEASDARRRAGTLVKALLIGTGIAGLATLGISQLDTTELNRLRENMDAFKNQWSGLIDVVGGIAEAMGVPGITGATIGSMFGLRAAIVGAVSGTLYNLVYQATGSESAALAAGGAGAVGTGALMFSKRARGLAAAPFRAAGNRISTATRLPARMRLARMGAKQGLRTAGRFAMSAPGAASIAATAAIIYGIDQTFKGIQTQTQTRAIEYWNRYGLFVVEWATFATVKTYRMIMEDRGIDITASRTSIINSNRSSDPYYYWNQVIESYGRGGTANRAKTWLAENGETWLDTHYRNGSFINPEDNQPIAPVRVNNQPNAIPARPAAAGGGSSAAPGIVAPMASSAAGQDATPLPPAAAGSIDAILDKTPQQLTDAELRQLVELQGRIENPSGSLNNPGGLPVSSARTTPYANNVIGAVGANGAPQVRIAKFDTAENGIRAAMWLWRNGSRYRGKPVRDGLGAWSTGRDGRNPDYERMLGSARPGWTGNPNIQPGFGGGAPGSFSSIAQSLADMGQGVIKGVGSIIKTGMGGYAPRSIIPASMNKPSEISKLSSSIQNDIDLGKDKSTSSAPGVSDMVAAAYRSVQNASPDGSLAAIDPNWPGSDGSVEAYLQYYKLAA